MVSCRVLAGPLLVRANQTDGHKPLKKGDIHELPETFRLPEEIVDDVRDSLDRLTNDASYPPARELPPAPPR